MIKPLLKRLELHSDQELIQINNDLNKLYKYFNKSTDVVKLLKKIKRKQNSQDFIKFLELSTIIDRKLAPFTDYYLKRNINIIQSSIQIVLDKRNRIVIKMIAY
jgi:hypothetical protein